MTGTWDFFSLITINEDENVVLHPANAARNIKVIL